MDETAALREKLKETLQRVEQLEAVNASLKTAEGSCAVFLDSTVGRVMVARIAELASLEAGLRATLQKPSATPTELLALVDSLRSSASSTT